MRREGRGGKSIARAWGRRAHKATHARGGSEAASEGGAAAAAAARAALHGALCAPQWAFWHAGPQ